MPKGKGRRPAPPGFLTPAETGKLLGENRLYKLVKDGRLKRHVPEGYQHGYYSRAEVQAILDAEAVFFGARQETPPLNSKHAVFAIATPDDMDALYAMAKKLFPSTANADRRRSWLQVEQRGHYIVKRLSDGAVMAYLYLLPFKPAHLASYLHGDLPSRMIEPEYIEPMEPGKPTSACVIGGIGSDPDIEQTLRSNYTSVLLRGVRQDLIKLGSEGITLPKLYAFSETNSGIAMCMRLGMEQWEPPTHDNKWFTFQVDLYTSNSFLFRGYKHALAEWQTMHQPQPAMVLNSTSTSPPSQKTKQASTRPSQPQKRASTKPPLPDGWYSVPAFAQRHGIAPTTAKKAITSGRLQDETNDWLSGRAPVKNAFNPEQQAAFIHYYRDERLNESFRQCEVPNCPCHQAQNREP